MSAPVLSPKILGQPLDRVDGRLKVTGAATYAAEFNPPGLLQGALVLSTISSGKITAIDTSAAEKMPGVRAIFSHLNKPKEGNAPKPGKQQKGEGISNELRFPFSDDKVHYGGQYVALAVAETFEQATAAAAAVKVSYSSKKSVINWAQVTDGSRPKVNNGEPVQGKKGDPEKVLGDESLVRLQKTYFTPTETHNPMEPSATVAFWEGPDRLVLYDATQYVKGVQDLLSRCFDLDRENVRVISPFVGGAFGCKGAVWPHVLLAAAASKSLGAPVKIAISRHAMFSGTGHRTPTRQTISIAANPDGKLQAIRHFAETLTSPVGDFVESCAARSTGVLYGCPNILLEETVYKTNVATPTFMRAPGECPGTYAVECAMDELAEQLKMDPLKLRQVNHSSTHPMLEKPWSTNHLLEAYTLGAEKFGWSKRQPEPGSMRDGDLLVGWGMATASYPGYKMAAAAYARLNADGTALVRCATHDLGTGAYTVFTQISAEALGLPVEKVTFELGSSDLPLGPVAGGSNSTATVGSAIYLVADKVHETLATMASADPQSPLRGIAVADILAAGEGRLTAKNDPGKTDRAGEILARSGKSFIEVSVEPVMPEKDGPVEFHSFGAHFCEVKIDPLQPRVQVTRVVSVMDCGRVMNAKTARSQIMGGVVMGLGMALTEETIYDQETGLPLTRNLADYHVPVNADIQNIEVHFVGEPDFAFNPMGGRGMGEIGITGIAAAVANAVHHATGKRIRELPITPDKLV